jgi:hypothetical protein
MAVLPRVLAGLFGALALATTTNASADEPPPEVIGAPIAPAPAAATRWYGWQPLVADANAVLLVLAASSTKSGALGLSGLGTYLLAPPIIHLAHGRPGAAAGSFTLRVILPFTGGLLGGALATGCSSGPYCKLNGVVLGGLAGLVSAIVIDAAAISYEELEPRASSQSASARATLTPAPYRTKLVPLVGPKKEGGLDVGLAVIF